MIARNRRPLMIGGPQIIRVDERDIPCSIVNVASSEQQREGVR